MAEEQLVATVFDAELRGQCREPGAVLGAGVGQRVVVGQLGEVVVAGVGVAAGAVLGGAPDGLVVVAAHADDRVTTQALDAAVGVRAEATGVAQEVEVVGAASAGVLDQCVEGEPVVVDPAEDSDHIRQEKPST